MAITEKENILKFYRHELPDHMLNPQFMHMLIGYGYLERPLEPRVVELLQLEPEKYDQYEVSMEDWFGVPYILDPASGSIPDPNAPHILTDITKWKKQVKFPDLEAYDWEAAARFDHADMVDRENKVLCVMVQCGLYERFHSLAGMENAMIWMLTEPEATQELLQAIADHKIRLFEKIIQYYRPDILKHHDDYGSQHAMQMNPDLWRQMIKPHIARFVELCHDNGVFYEQHSCGFVEPIIPDFVEIGIDSWQGMHINDVPKLKKLTAGKLNFNMTLNHQQYMADDYAGKLTEESLRKQARETIMECAGGGNYFPGLALAPGDYRWWGAAVLRDEIAHCIAEVKI